MKRIPGIACTVIALGFLAMPALRAVTFVVTTDPTRLPLAKFVEAFAFSTDSEPLIAEIRAKISAGQSISPIVKIVGGGDGINRNFLAAGTPAWHWHVDEVVTLEGVGVPEDYGTPSLKDMDDQVTQAPEAYQPNFHTQLWLRKLTRIYEIAPDNPGRLVNLSNRGVLGTGNKVLIAGFVVTGTTPRLVLLRGQGPSLAALGVPEAASDPHIWLYRGATVLAENDDWASAATVDSIPQGLTPGSAKESAIVAVLEPGVYSVHGSSPDQGVGLLEVFDLSGF